MNILDYLGKPWVRFGRGPDSFDCWGLVRHFYAQEFDLDLPLHVIAPERLAEVVKTMRSSLENDWVQVEEMQENCLVVMSSKRQPHHVGACISHREKTVLHCASNQNTCCQPLSHIERAMAINKVSFYLPRQWHTSSSHLTR
jgi:hypothetical protein